MKHTALGQELGGPTVLIASVGGASAVGLCLPSCNKALLEYSNAVVLNLWVTSLSQGLPKTIGKHRYVMIHNSSSITVMK